MERLLDILLCGGVAIIEILGIIAILLLIQGLFYRKFKINIYKNCINYFKKLEIKIEEVL